MITRRDVVGGVAALLGVAPVAGKALAAPAALHFDVLRNGSNIGQHTVSFGMEGDTLVATVAVEIVVRLGPVALFRYHHTVREIWRGDRFLSLDSETNDDGKRFRVHAIQAGGHVLVETAAVPRGELAPETIPLTHWNSLCMQRPLFNPQDGLPFDYTIIPRGEEMVTAGSGKLVRATHYSVAGKRPLEDWYDTSHQWVALRSTGSDGSSIEYRLAA